MLLLVVLASGAWEERLGSPGLLTGSLVLIHAEHPPGELRMRNAHQTTDDLSPFVRKGMIPNERASTLKF